MSENNTAGGAAVAVGDAEKAVGAPDPNSFAVKYKWLIDVHEPLIEGSRDPSRFIIRMHCAEDVICASILGVISGIDMGCQAQGWSMVFVCTMHILYLGILRPQESKIDFGMSFISAIVQLAVVAMALLTPMTDDWDERFYILVIVASGWAFVQIGIGVAVAAYEAYQKAKEKRMKKSGDLEGDVTSVPLLETVPAAGGDGGVSNRGRKGSEGGGSSDRGGGAPPQPQAGATTPQPPQDQQRLNPLLASSSPSGGKRK